VLIPNSPSSPLKGATAQDVAGSVCCLALVLLSLLPVVFTLGDA